MDEDMAVFLSDFCEFLSGLEASIARMRGQIAKLVGAVEKQAWRVVESPRPVPADDRAVKWLERKLAEIKTKHPSLRYEFARTPEGLVSALRYMPEDDEVDEDVKAVAEWAFEKASSKPI